MRISEKLLPFIGACLLLNTALAQTKVSFASLPLQISFNQSASATYKFDSAVVSIQARNPGVVSWVINDSQVVFTGIKPGRTGLKISTKNRNYFMGVRVNHSNGNMPGLPPDFSMGSVSEDTPQDLSFWEDIQPGKKNKAMDLRYIYINGGPLSGWASWGPQRPGLFARQSLKHGLIPFFVYYNIPDGGESYSTDLNHIQDPAYMSAYFNNLNQFIDSVQNVLKGELFGIILEPDFLGYLEQNASPSDPASIPTAVSAHAIAAKAGSVVTFVQRVNATIQAKRNAGCNIFFGWQLNLWSCPSFQGTTGIIRASDSYPLSAAKYLIQYSARQTVMYGMAAGILSYGADFISIDKYGLDAMGYQNTSDPAQSTWFWNNDHWNNYLLYAHAVHQASGKPVMLWQLPVGHINGTTCVSAYTGATYANMTNTTNNYEDSSPDFFLGDTIKTTDTARLKYFSLNLWKDNALNKNGSLISWQNHISSAKNAGVISALFGAGVGSSTKGTGAPPTDNYYWIQKVQDYYLNAPVPLDSTYAEGPLNRCLAGCAPQIAFVSPGNNDTIYRSALDTARLYFNVTGNSSPIASITAWVDGIIIPTRISSSMQYSAWVPPTGWGKHLLKVTAADSANVTTTSSIIFYFMYADPAGCGYPQWNATTAYSTAGAQVTYNGLIYQNKYWTQGDYPYLGGSSSPWTLTGICSFASPTFINDKVEDESQFALFPNPTAGDVQVYAPGAEGEEITVSDVLGNILLKRTLARNAVLDLSGFRNGIYVVRLKQGNGYTYRKIVKK